jgi:hypothetical protein
MSPSAVADGLHLLPRVWTLGCAINFSMDARTETEYGPNVISALENLHVATGFGFTRLAAGDTRASIRFETVDDIPGGYAGMAYYSGKVELLTTSRIGASFDPSRSSMARDEIVIHETLHELGLDHDQDEGAAISDEMMYPATRWGVLSFGEGDREGMAHVSALNGCVPPDPTAQPVPTVPLANSRPTSAAPLPRPADPVASGVTDQAASAADMGEKKATPESPSPPTVNPPPTALERCLSHQGLRVMGADGYCPPLKHEVPVSRGSQLGRHGESTSSS